METDVTALQSTSRFVVSKFSRQRYMGAISALNVEVASRLVPKCSLVTPFTGTCIIAPDTQNQIIAVGTGVTTVRVRKPINGCTEFTLLMQTPATLAVNAFPSGTILPQITAAQVVNSIRFVWDAINVRWRSVRTK